MGIWAHLRRRRAATATRSGEENLLVISDIHLGEDILVGGPDHLAEHIRVLNRELAQFVDFYRRTTLDGRAWHLVINGDMFDFVKVSVLPEPGDSLYKRWRQVGRDGGENITLPNTPENVVWKLERILDIHRPLFKELAAFLLDGHRVSIIEGNHDAEFYFEEVRVRLRRYVVELAEGLHAGRKQSGSFDAEKIGEAFRFRTWFMASPGRYHIEHGHQYDEYCSFEYNLAPLDHREADTLATPFTHRVVPHLAELLGDFSTHGIDKWTFTDAVRFVFGLGPRMFWAIAKVYFRVAFELLGESGERRKEELKARGEGHRARLQALGRGSPYSEVTITALDRMKATPVEFSFWKTLRVFYLDRFLTALASFAGVFIGLLVGGSVGLILASGSLLFGSGSLLLQAMSRATDVPDILRRAAAQVAGLTGTRYVIFGHSHDPELVDLKDRYGIGQFGEAAFYLNTGSWVTREILLGKASTGMTYAEVTSRGAALKRWQSGEHSSVVLADTSSTVHPINGTEAHPRKDSVVPTA